MLQHGSALVAAGRRIGDLHVIPPEQRPHSRPAAGFVIDERSRHLPGRLHERVQRVSIRPFGVAEELGPQREDRTRPLRLAPQVKIGEPLQRHAAVVHVRAPSHLVQRPIAHVFEATRQMRGQPLTRVVLGQHPRGHGSDECRILGPALVQPRRGRIRMVSIPKMERLMTHEFGDLLGRAGVFGLPRFPVEAQEDDRVVGHVPMKAHGSGRLVGDDDGRRSGRAAKLARVVQQRDVDFGLDRRAEPLRHRVEADQPDVTAHANIVGHADVAVAERCLQGWPRDHPIVGRPELQLDVPHQQRRHVHRGARAHARDRGVRAVVLLRVEG